MPYYAVEYYNKNSNKEIIEIVDIKNSTVEKIIKSSSEENFDDMIPGLRDYNEKYRLSFGH